MFGTQTRSFLPCCLILLVTTITLNSTSAIGLKKDIKNNCEALQVFALALFKPESSKSDYEELIFKIYYV